MKKSPSLLAMPLLLSVVAACSQNGVEGSRYTPTPETQDGCLGGQGDVYQFRDHPNIVGALQFMLSAEDAWQIDGDGERIDSLRIGPTYVIPLGQDETIDDLNGVWTRAYGQPGLIDDETHPLRTIEPEDVELCRRPADEKFEWRLRKE